MFFNIQKVSFTNSLLIQKTLDTLFFLKQDYPQFRLWYKTKVISGLENNSRQIYIATPENNPDCIAAVMILKNDGNEKKISTLCVLDQYRSLGLGSRLMHLAIKVLNSPKPIITVSDTHMNEFDPLLKKFGFEHFHTYPGYYKDKISEHAYNGYLNSNVVNNNTKAS